MSSDRDLPPSLPPLSSQGVSYSYQRHHHNVSSGGRRSSSNSSSNSNYLPANHPPHPFFPQSPVDQPLQWDVMAPEPVDGRLSPPPPIEPANSLDIEDDEFDELSWDEESAMVDSITSSLMRHEFENGRRFHKFRYGRYPLPNDDDEQDRDLIKHAMTLELTNGKLFFAPISSNPQRIMDLGTGTGHWAFEVADLFPSAQVLGIDLSPIQPDWLPPNLEFTVDDMEDTWIHGDDFDLMHIRHVMPSMKDVPALFARCFANLRPGGWLEVQEFGGEILCDDGTMPDDFAPKRLMDMCEASLRKFGMEFRITNRLGEPFREAGFVDVRCHTIRAPVGTWPKHKTLRLAGYYLSTALSDLFTAMAARPLRALGLSKEELDETLKKAKEGLDDRKTHGYLNYHFWMAQKPLTPSMASTAS